MSSRKRTNKNHKCIKDHKMRPYGFAGASEWCGHDCHRVPVTMERGAIKSKTKKEVDSQIREESSD